VERTARSRTGRNDYVLIVRPGLPDAVTANGFEWLASVWMKFLAMTKAAA